MYPEYILRLGCIPTAMVKLVGMHKSGHLSALPVYSHLPGGAKVEHLLKLNTVPSN